MDAVPVTSWPGRAEKALKSEKLLLCVGMKGIRSGSVTDMRLLSVEPEQRGGPWSTRSPGLASVEHLLSQCFSAGCSPADQGEARPQLASHPSPAALANAPSAHLQLLLRCQRL